MHEKRSEFKTRVAEIVMGLREGYGGSVHLASEVVAFLQRRNAQAMSEKHEFVSFRVAEATIVHGHVAGTSQCEPSVVLTGTAACHSSYLVKSDWEKLISDYVIALAAEFKQYQVYVLYHEATVVVFQDASKP